MRLKKYLDDANALRVAFSVILWIYSFLIYIHMYLTSALLAYLQKQRLKCFITRTNVMNLLVID